MSRKLNNIALEYGPIIHDSMIIVNSAHYIVRVVILLRFKNLTNWGGGGFWQIDTALVR